MKYIYCILIILFLNFSCKKKEDESVKQNPCGSTYGQTAHLPSDLSNFRFKMGTYWVMLDSMSGTTDSIIVTFYEEGFDSDMCMDYEFYKFNTYSYLPDEAFQYEMRASSTAIFKNGAPIYSSGSPHLDSLSVNNQYYYNVVMTTVSIDATQGNYKGVYYIDYNGFIRIDAIDNSSGAVISKKLLLRRNIVR